MMYIDNISEGVREGGGGGRRKKKMRGERGRAKRSVMTSASGQLPRLLIKSADERRRGDLAESEIRPGDRDGN